MTVPKESRYEVDDRQIIVKTPDVRVVILTLGKDQEVPYHFHTVVTDTVTCLNGPMVVNTLDDPDGKVLQEGEIFTIPPETPHRVAGKDGGPCKFLIVQGVGKYDVVFVDAPS